MSLLNNNREIILMQITKKLYPLIYQGLESIYNEAVKISEQPKNSLKNFQLFLKKIPDWNIQMVEQEKRRIMLKLDDPNVIELLIKSYVKLSVIQLTGMSLSSLLKFDQVQEINMNTILHNIYIEIARELFSNPFLMYDQVSPIEQKKNQNVVLDIIKNSIRDVLIGTLPWEEISLRIIELKEEEFIKHTPQINNYMGQSGGGPLEVVNNEVKDIVDQMITPSKAQKVDNEITSPQFIDTPEKTKKEIIGIIDDAMKKTSEKNQRTEKDSEKSDKSEKKEKDSERKVSEKEEKEEEKVIELGGGGNKASRDMDTSSIKNMLNDLDESDTSISHVPPSEDGFSGYADVFTNKNINTEEKTKKLTKNKFFSNYLKV